MGERLSGAEVQWVVNRYIGVRDGYLGDFSYASHAEFYAVYCDLDVDPNQYSGTTRARFVSILTNLPAREQAMVLRGLLERFPLEDSAAPRTRDEAAKTRIEQFIARLEADELVQVEAQLKGRAVVLRAISDAEHLIRSSGAVSAVDRIHTALHGYLIEVCQSSAIPYDPHDTMVALFKKLRSGHPKLADLGPRAQDIEKVLNSCASIMDAMLPVRNKASVSHPNEQLVEEAEARLIVNVGRTVLNYLDSKLGT